MPTPQASPEDGTRGLRDDRSPEQNWPWGPQPRQQLQQWLPEREGDVLAEFVEIRQDGSRLEAWYPLDEDRWELVSRLHIDSGPDLLLITLTPRRFFLRELEEEGIVPGQHLEDELEEMANVILMQLPSRVTGSFDSIEIDFHLFGEVYAVRSRWIESKLTMIFESE